MRNNSWPLAMLAAGVAASASFAYAHEVVGNRFFPATLAIDDPGFNDELALPTVEFSRTGDDPTTLGRPTFASSINSGKPDSGH